MSISAASAVPCPARKDWDPTATPSVSRSTVIVISELSKFAVSAISIFPWAAIKSPEAVEAIENGDEVVVDMKNGKIITAKGDFKFPPYPETVMEILENNGLIYFIKNKINNP